MLSHVIPEIMVIWSLIHIAGQVCQISYMALNNFYLLVCFNAVCLISVNLKVLTLTPCVLPRENDYLL